MVHQIPIVVLTTRIPSSHWLIRIQFEQLYTLLRNHSIDTVSALLNYDAYSVTTYVDHSLHS